MTKLFQKLSNDSRLAKTGRTLAFLSLLLSLAPACKSELAIWIGNNLNGRIAFHITSETNLVHNTLQSIKWEVVPSAREYEAVIARDKDCSSVIFNKEKISEAEVNLESLAEGDYSICIFAIIGPNRIPAANNGIKFTIDKTAPTVESIGDVASYSSPFQFNLSIDDKTQVTARWSQEATGKEVTIDDPEAANPTFSCAESGLYKVYAEFTDQAGNVSTYSYQFYWNNGQSSTSVPVFTDLPLAGPLLDGYLNAAEHATSLPIVGNINATNYNAAKMSLVTASNVCDAALNYGDIPLANSALFTGAGSYRVCLELGNGTSIKVYGSSAVFTYSPHPASIGTVNLSGHAVDGLLSLAEHAMTSDLITIPAFANAASKDYAVTLFASSCSGPLVYASVIPKSDDARFTATGNYKVCVRAQDQALNPVVYGESAAITFRSAPPLISSFVKANGASDGYINNSEKASTAAAWTLTASGFASEAYSLPLSDSGSALICDQGVVYGQTGVARIVDIGSDGTWAICVKLSDAAGNISYGKSEGVIRDIISPTAAFTTLDTIDRTPALAGTVTDPTAVVSVSVNGSDYTAANNGLGAWTIADNVIPTLPFGLFDVSVTASDSAGNSVTTQHINRLKITSQYFVSQWTSNMAGGFTANDKITLPLVNGGTYNFLVNWGDGQSDTITAYNAPAVTHTYSSPGTYTVTISGTIIGWRFNNGGDKTKIVNISVWGPLRLGNNENYFSGAVNMTITATDGPDLTGTTQMYNAFANCRSITTIPNVGRWQVGSVISMEGMFRDNILFNDDISAWDTHSATDMKDMFQGATLFNSPLGDWDVSHVTRMEGMFMDAFNFNQNIDDWDVSAVTSMSSMFRSAKKFDQQLSDWDVHHVTNFNGMFYNTELFNGDISGWVTTSAVTMREMFFDAVKFNQDIGGWNTSLVTSMESMFSNAKVFNQNLNLWTVSNVTNFSGMFRRATAFNGNITTWVTTAGTNMSEMFLDTNNFNQNISGWSTANVTNMTGMFQSATAFNQAIGTWNVSKVTSFRSMFMNAVFNQDLSTWNTVLATDMSEMFRNNAQFDSSPPLVNVANVTTMKGMFQNASLFDKPLNAWNVSNVTNFAEMFRGASKFNQALNNWIPSAATNMSNMFDLALEFNQNISGWNVSSVTSFRCMFRDARKFNQPIGAWTLGSPTDLVEMFSNALLFDQSVAAWNVTTITQMDGMFYGVTLSTANYDAVLQAWAGQAVQNNVIFHGGNSKFSAGAPAAAKATLVSKGWAISDAGQAP